MAGTNWENPSSITKVVIENTIVQTTAKNWFFNCANLPEIENINNLNTSNVTNMMCMFANCENITSLNLSGCDVSKVIDMSNLFFNKLL